MTTAKATLRNRGSGKLEFANNTLRFYVERGRFKKTFDLVREIPVADVENAVAVDKEFSVTWKGVADVFDVESAESAKALCNEVNAARMQPQEAVEPVAVEPAKPVEAKAAEVKAALREEVREAEEVEQVEEAPQQQPQEPVKLFALGRMVGVALDVADSLFDVLLCLQGRVDWNRVESGLKRAEEYAEGFAGEELFTLSLDFAGVLSAVKLRGAGEVGKEIFEVLKLMFEYFKGLSVPAERLGNAHPSCEDAGKMVLAGYLLDDVALGVVVGDCEVAKEGDKLVGVLEDLSKETGVEMDAVAVKAAVGRLIAEKAGEAAVAEGRAVFRKQLEELLNV
jgi:hypothetical protein